MHRRTLALLPLIFLCACSSVRQVTPFPTSPTAPTTRTPVPPTPTHLPTVAVPLTPTATPIPPSFWADGVDLVEVKGDFRGGLWSPLAHEIAITENQIEGEELKLIRLVGPEFKPQLISPVTSRFIWSLDGQTIYFSGPPYPTGQYYDLTQHSGGWAIDHKGKNPAEFLSGPGYDGRYFAWLGWIDPQTIVTSSYTGGGHVIIDVHNIKTGKILADTEIQGGTFSIGKDLLAFDNIEPPIVGVIGKNTPRRINKYSDVGGYDNANFIQLNKHNGLPVSTCFEDWLPGKNRMLLAWDGFNQQQPSYALYWWDVDRNTVTEAANNAVSGDISPDGKTLAFITDRPEISSQIQFYPDRFGKDPVLAYLHLQNLVTNQVSKISIPVLAIDSGVGDCSLPHPSPEIAFSPNGQYLALEPGQELLLNPAGALADRQDGKSGDYLYILDIPSGRVVWAQANAAKPSWSPNGKDLLFRNGDHLWMLMDIISHKQTLLTQAPIVDEDIAWSTSWSFDGTYLMVNINHRDQGASEIAFIKTP